MFLNSPQRNQNILNYLILFLSIYFTSCFSGSNKETLKNEDFVIKRFEKDLFELDQSKFEQSLQILQEKYGDFYSLYIEKIVGFGSTKDSTYKVILKDFINNTDLKTLYHDTDSIYRDFTPITQQLKEMFQVYHTLFPKDTLPEVITFISGFNNGIVTSDHLLGIGLDMFLGKNYKFYPSLEFPQYIIRRLTKEHLAATLAKGMASAKYELSSKNPTFAEEMIYEGKLLYFIDQMLPNTEDTLKIAYTKEQLSWCKENEANIWALFIEEDMLFSTDKFKYKRYLEEAPFTVGLSNNSAPRIGIWCGWQIVKKYMEESSGVSLKQLMEEKNYQKIIKGSKYKPKYN